MKDAVIGLAILVALLFAWRLLTRPDRFGVGGGALRTNLFGAYGAGVADAVGLGVGSAPSPAQGANPGALATVSPPEDTRSTQSPSAFVVTRPGTNGHAPGAGASGDSNAPIEVIGSMPDQIIEARLPTASSPDAAAMASRLAQAGARTGDIQLSLSWNDYNDLDLHCFDPQGEEIYYMHRVSGKTGGTLDVDRNASEPFVRTPIENIYWPPSGAPPGIYKVFLVYYAQHPAPSHYAVPFTVRTVVEDKTNYFSGKIAFTGRRESNWICSFQYDPNNADRTQHRRFLSTR